MAAQFLWGGRERPDTQAFVPRRSIWWEQYASGLSTSPNAKNEVLGACRSLMGLLPDPQDWSDAPKPLRGLVVGAVQSGKTASMIGLTALALDQGYRIVIVLTGNKDDLRRQTARRFNVQLLRRSELIPDAGGARTIREETASNTAPAFCLPYNRDAHQQAGFHMALQAALERGEPAVIVIKKHISSLADVRRKLEIAYQRLGVEALPTLVLDDECDEASIDREEVAIPTAIAGLWRRSGDPPLAAYVGYTATSAANLLQQQDNELFPQDFVYLLRYPAGEETALGYSEPSPNAWYTGGHAFFEAFGEEAGPGDNFLIAATVTTRDLQGPVRSNASLQEAVRAYIVAGAYRLALDPGWSLEEAARCPLPHTMLVQTSSSQMDHRRWLDAMAGLFAGTRDQRALEYRWYPAAVMDSVAQQEGPWRRWYEEFSSSRARVLAERPRVASGGFANWDQVRACIPAFVEFLRIKVVNSDEEIGSDLDFAPRIGAEGNVLRPKDVFVIVIGGAKLSRGLTIDGLCVTYFTRWTPSPTEDTVLQLSRWYGYRGPHLEFCRLFTTPEIHERLREMHDNDRDLREGLASLMRTQKSPVDAAIVIRTNPKALPTAKIGQGKVYDLSFSPFATVFRHVECTDADLQGVNQAVALELVEGVQRRSPERVVAASGSVRGMVSGDWSATEVAEVLEGLLYSDHNPSAAANPARDYYRRPDNTRAIVGNRNLTEDPYQIAAYLRQWAAQGDAPTFNVGVAHGELAAMVEPFAFPLVNRKITDSGEVIGGWTGRRAGWRGDQLFDDPEGGQVVPGTMERYKGATGLLLLYVVHREAVGRHGGGKVRPYHTPVLGIVIPDGGPLWRRVTVDRRRVVAE